MEPKNCTREQALLLENLRSSENRVLENAAKRALREAKTDVDFVYPDPVSKSLLDVACCEGRTDFVEHLLQAGADVNRINEAHNRAPIHFAVEAGHGTVLEILLDDPRTKVDLAVGGQTALHIAARKNEIECARILLAKGRANPNVVNSKGLTPIHVAATTGRKEMVGTILRASTVPVDIDGFRDFRNLSTRDVLLAKMPDLEIPAPLITGERGSSENDEAGDPESRFLKDSRREDVDLEESMKTAARLGYSRAAAELMRRGVGAGLPRYGEAAAKIALELGRRRVLGEILSVDPSLANALLLPACRELAVPTLGGEEGVDERAACLELVMRQPGVNVRCQDEKGNTPLHYAARAESAEAVRRLLRAGSYIGRGNALGVPPLAHLSPSVLSDFFDECIRCDDDRTDEFEVEFDYRCLVPHGSEPRSPEDDPEVTKNERSGKSVGCEMETLAYVSANRALRPLLKHPLLSSFLYLKWHRIRHVFYANFLLYVFFYALVNLYVLSTSHQRDDSENSTSGALNNSSGESSTSSSKSEGAQGLRILAGMAVALLALRESVQLFSAPWRYLSNLESLLQIALVILAGWVLVDDDPRIGAIVVLLSAWQLVVLMGQHPRMSTDIEMFKTVSINFARFLFLYAFLILAFALAFFTLFKDSKDDDNFPDPGHSIFKTIIMLTGEFDANDIPFVAHPVFSHCVFILFVFLIAIVLFNLLNGLAVSDTADILNKSELVVLVSRVRLISHAESVALGSGFVGSTRRCCSPSFFLDPLRFLARRMSLFPRCLPRAKIGVKPYKSNAIRVHGRSTTGRECSRWSMDPWIVQGARQILSKRGRISDNDRIITELVMLRTEVQRLESLVKSVNRGSQS